MPIASTRLSTRRPSSPRSRTLRTGVSALSLAIAALASTQAPAQSYTYIDGEVRGAGVTAPATLTVDAGGSATQAGAITGPGAVNKAGDGTLSLTGASSYSSTTISGGVLRILDGGTVTNNGTLSLTGANAGLIISGIGSGLTTGANLGAIGSAAGVTMTVEKGGTFQNTTGNINIANVAGTNATLNVIGAGSEFRTQSAISSLHGNATYNIIDGGAIIHGGQIAMGASIAGAGSGSATILISGAGSRWQSGAGYFGEVSLRILDGGVMQNGNMSIGHLGGKTSNILISGAGSLHAVNGLVFGTNGTGIITVAEGGTFSFVAVAPSRVLTINKGGTINIGGAVGEAATGAGHLGVSSIVFAGGTGSLNFNHTDSGYLFDQAMTGDGVVNHTGPGTTILTGNSSYSGGTTISAGTLQLGNGGSSGSITGNAINNGVLAFNRSDAMTFAGSISGSGAVTQTGVGTTTLTATNTYTGATTIQAGTLALTGAGSIAASSGVRNNGTFDISATTAGASIRTLSGRGVVDTGAQTLTLTAAADTFDGTFQGTGGLTLSSGAETLTGNSSGFSGATTVQAGRLSVNGSLGGTMAVLGGRLQGVGTVGTTTNEAGGTIAPGNSIGTLTINGNYLGNGGRLEIETVLGGDASPSDRLVVTGSAAGSTLVTVLNQGGNGAPTVEGIKVVDVGGASNGRFSLANGDYAFQGQPALIAGAYAYTLQQNGVSTPGDGDWYLRSTYVQPAGAAAPVGSSVRTMPIFQPGVPLYEAYGQVLQSLNGLPTLRQRVGDRVQGESGAAAGTPESRAIWARIEGAHSRVTPRLSTSGTSYEIDSWKLQAGVEGQLLGDGAGTLIGGLTAHHGGATADVASVFGRGKIDTSGTGFGGTLTWYGQSGFYADAQAQVSWFDSDLTSTTAGRRLADGKGGFGYAFGLELGQRIALGGAWSLTPQAQLIYSKVDSSGFTDPFGARVSLDDGDSLKGRLGLGAEYRNSWRGADGQLVGATLYGIANLSYEFLDGTTANVSGARFTSAEERLWGGVGLGAKYDWAGGRYAVYGEVSAKTSLAQFADSHELSGRAGFRMSW
ncbi:autotransporter outer membrane beta-barrel domain-containing protein [Bosea lathyri]|uniref:Fibronectin-binding autotransporter adhesin n=1 Tax=Bosea lathyri TaxID=1036778 RepID=A0A1H6C012_9HYPH|nr:autotransporter outer membrane beta-barrel domain-containing protein [Bosea lathyri]SEG66025.1 fibronectin-binding autotransporter adhesin [Bosea lathyri]